MTGCCAVGCTNRSERGFKLYYLPRGEKNELRRKAWLVRIRRKNFKPSKRTALCHEHFEPDQFENRVPGKLLPNAIPSVFVYGEEPDSPKNKKCTKHIITSQLDNVLSSPHQVIFQSDDTFSSPVVPLTSNEKHCLNEWRPHNHPDHPDYVPSVFVFNNPKAETESKKKLKQFENTHGCLKFLDTSQGSFEVKLSAGTHHSTITPSVVTFNKAIEKDQSMHIPTSCHLSSKTQYPAVATFSGRGIEKSQSLLIRLEKDTNCTEKQKSCLNNNKGNSSSETKHPATTPVVKFNDKAVEQGQSLSMQCERDADLSENQGLSLCNNRDMTSSKTIYNESTDYITVVPDIVPSPLVATNIDYSEENFTFPSLPVASSIQKREVGTMTSVSGKDIDKMEKDLEDLKQLNLEMALRISKQWP